MNLLQFQRDIREAETIEQCFFEKIHLILENIGVFIVDGSLKRKRSLLIIFSQYMKWKRHYQSDEGRLFMEFMAQMMLKTFVRLVNDVI